MTVIRPNSISGVTSITALGDNISFYNSDGVNISQFNANINATSGVSTIANLTVGFITATSTSITGNVTVGGNVSIAGTLTYEDVTNVDSIGLVTARSGIVLTGGVVTLGTGVTASGSTANTFTVSTNGSERVRVSSAGSFAIGNTNPSALLDVSGNAKTSTLQIGTNPAGVSIGVLGIPNQKRIYGRNAANSADVNILYIDGSNGMVFGPNDAAVIDSSGRFGVGAASPATTFHLAAANVAGNDNIGNVFIATTDALASDIGGKLTLGALYNATQSYAMGGIAGRRENATNNNVAGYLQFLTCTSGGTLSERARISSTGGFSVGTTANPGTGAIYATGDITAFYSSDIRLKKDIEPISEPIKKLMEISGVTYKWNEEYLKDKEVDGYFVRETEVGVIAQEVEKVLPEVVATRENGYKAVRYEKLVALLIEAVKDQQHQIDELKARLEEK